MTPKKLTLQNFIGIRSGLGRDELVLDIDALSDGTELVALIGPNGTGKTTVLDSLQPFRVMPFRSGGYSPGSFSFYDNVLPPEALKELVWEHDGAVYRSTLVFKQPGKTRKTEAYLHVQDGDAWSPYTAADGTISDGKTDTYDRCVEAVIGSPEMFFTSAFSAQGRKTLSSYGNGEIKGLMSELLGLDRVLALGKQASDVAKGLRAQHNGMGDAIARVTEAERQKSAAVANQERDRASLKNEIGHRQAARDAVQRAQRELSELQASASANAATEARRSELEGQISATRSHSGKQARDVNQDIDAVKASLRQSEAATQETDAKADKQRAELDAQIQKQTDLLDRRADLAAAASRKQTLQAEEPGFVAAVDRAREQSDVMHTKQTELSRLNERLQSLARSGREMAESMSHLEQRSALVGEVPCAGTELPSQCKLLADAMTARDKLPVTQAEVEKRREDYACLQDQVSDLQKGLESAGDVGRAVLDAEQALTQHRQLIADADKTLALKDAIENAEELIASSRRQIASLTADRKAREQAVKTERTATAERIGELQSRLQSIQKAMDDAIQAAHAELDRLPPPTDTAMLEQAEQSLEDADAALAASEHAIEHLHAQIAQTEATIKTADAELERSTHIQSLAARLETEIAHWTTLAKALSNDGIVALSIDDAGPTLASLTNDLLTSCYGPRYSVRIDTQRQTQAGDLREAFDIIVFDAERDDEKSVRMTSGGERIWINEALTRAIALYQAQTSGQTYGCLFADESDGALDPARKQQFISMKRKVLELGNYERELFISHTPALWEAADAVIDLSTYRIH